MSRLRVAAPIGGRDTRRGCCQGPPEEEGCGRRVYHLLGLRGDPTSPEGPRGQGAKGHLSSSLPPGPPSVSRRSNGTGTS